MRAPVCCLELPLRFRHQRRRAGEAQLDRAEVDLAGAHVGMVEDGGVERRDAVEERRLHLLDRLQQVADVARVRHERQRVRADERQRLHADVGVDVEQRQRQHDHVDPRLLAPTSSTRRAAGRRRRSAGAGRRRPSACRSCRRSTGSPRGRRAATVTAGRGDAAVLAQQVLQPGDRRRASVMRCPSFFSLNSVNSTRSTGGRYSLIDVAMTRRTRGARLRRLDARCRTASARRPSRRRVDVERLLELALAVGRVQRDDDRPRLPRAELARRRTAGSSAGAARRGRPAARRSAASAAANASLSASSCAVGHRRALEQQRRLVAVIARELDRGSRAASCRDTARATAARRSRSAPARASDIVGHVYSRAGRKRVGWEVEAPRNGLRRSERPIHTGYVTQRAHETRGMCTFLRRASNSAQLRRAALRRGEYREFDEAHRAFQQVAAPLAESALCAAARRLRIRVGTRAGRPHRGSGRLCYFERSDSKCLGAY